VAGLCPGKSGKLGEIGDHLGQIYEKEGRKAESHCEPVYILGHSLLPVPRMTDTRARLVALLASDNRPQPALTQKPRSGPS